MKKLTSLLVLIFCTSTLFAQKKVETVTLSNGKRIAVYDDKTWEYDKEGKSVPSSSSSKPTESNSFYSTPSKSSKTRSSYQKSYNSSYSSTCGARTKKGGSCRRTVSGGGRCWQHGG